MGYNNLFGDGHKHHKHSYDSRYEQDNYHYSSDSYNRHSDMKQILFQKLQNNPQLKSILILVAVIILVIIVVIIVFIFPLLSKFFEYISANGIQGIIDTIWNGTKK